MILKIQIIDDNGEVKAEASGDVSQPVQWKCPPNQPLIVKRPKTHDGGDNGEYRVFNVTAQPLCILVMGQSQTPVQFPQNPPIAVPGMYPSVGYANPQPSYPPVNTGNPLGDIKR